MEKDSRKNQKIHKNVGLFKSTIERKTRIKIREKENRLGSHPPISARADEQDA